MGICSSCESTSVATAKLISHDGRLQEFPYAVKVSYVLLKNPASFICNSDEIHFDDIVLGMSGVEELQPGQLYFALPLSRLRKKIPAEEMAALAVKASGALNRDKCGCRRSSVLVFPEESGGGRTTGRKPAVGGGGRRRRRKFAAGLSAIAE